MQQMGHSKKEKKEQPPPHCLVTGANSWGMGWQGLFSPQPPECTPYYLLPPPSPHYPTTVLPLYYSRSN